MPGRQPPPAQPDPQQDPCGDLPPAALPTGSAAQPVVRVAAADRPLSREQREFNRLTDLIARRRQALAGWQAMQQTCQQRAAQALVPEQRQLAAVQRDAVLWIDAYLADPPRGERLTNKPRQKLVFLLLTLARAVLDQQPDAEVEAAHDRHAVRSRAEDQRVQIALAARMLGELTGDQALFQGEADAAAHEPAWARHKAAARARKAQAKAEQAQREASQSVREVYRRLASQLHPDREPDAAERARKTALMARVNEAYDRRDLLTLLTLQLAVAQIDTGHLAALPDARLAPFCRVLREQLATLDDELAQITAPLAAALGARPDRIQPQDMALALDQQIRQTRDAAAALAQDMRWLHAPATRPEFLRQLEIDDPDEDTDALEALRRVPAFDDAIADLAVPDAPRRRGSRRRPR